MPERKSFRAYTAIMYLDPRMKIYIQVVEVITSSFAYKKSHHFIHSCHQSLRLEQKGPDKETDDMSIQVQVSELFIFYSVPVRHWVI